MSYLSCLLYLVVNSNWICILSWLLLRLLFSDTISIYKYYREHNIFPSPRDRGSMCHDLGIISFSFISNFRNSSPLKFIFIFIDLSIWLKCCQGRPFLFLYIYLNYYKHSLFHPLPMIKPLRKQPKHFRIITIKFNLQNRF